ncbi:hypothetical protein HKBW3S34_02197, partial [Candidatus Hakubella thermalkaliphila]
MKTISYLTLVLVVLVATILPLGGTVAKAKGPERYDMTWNYGGLSDVFEGSTFRPGATFTVRLGVTNQGNFTWNAKDHQHPHHIHLSYRWYDHKGNLVQRDGLRSHFPRDVAPGVKLHHFFDPVEVTVKVPKSGFPPAGPGPYDYNAMICFDLVREGVTWFSWVGASPLCFSTKVEKAPEPPRYSAVYNDHNSTPSIMAAGSKASFNFGVQNTGAATWNRGGSNPVHISYHWYDRRGRVVVWDGLRTKLPKDVAPGEGSGTFTITIKAPSTPGTY